MSTVTIKIFNKKEYYNADELQIKQPHLFKGCRNSRALLDKKEIDEDNYVFANMLDGRWKRTDGLSKKFDKLFLLKEWVDEELQNSEVIEDAPQIIMLEDNEKFTDDGNVIEIETRGQRDVNACYFKLSDVAEGYKMKSLCRTVTDDQHKYEKDKHYVYFNYEHYSKKHARIKYKKEPFLTYIGFMRVINVSRMTLNKNTTISMIKWLEQFSGEKLDEYAITIPTLFQKRYGYVYLITSPLLNAIKIGYWRSTYELLRSRYVTPYGNDLYIHTITSYDVIEMEKKVHNRFDKYRITNELFEKKYLNKYIEYVNKHDDNINICDMYDDDHV